MNHLNPRLLNNLEQHYHNIALLYSENVDLEEIRMRLKISDTDMIEIEDVMFDKSPIYTALNIFGNTVHYKYNASTGKSQEVDKYGIPKGY